MYPSNSRLTSVNIVHPLESLWKLSQNQVGHMANRFYGGKEMYFLYMEVVLGN